MEWLIKPFMHLEKLLRHLGEAGVLHDILHCSGGSSQQTSTPSRLSELFAQSSMSSKTHSSRVQIILITCIVCLHLVSATIAPRPGSSWSGGSSSSKGRKSYYAGPRPGFTGGQALNNNRPRWCTSPELPGCQACYDGRCTACWGQYPNTTGTSYGLGPPGGSRFVLNLATGQCDCPPGYGLLPIPPPPLASASRHMLSQLPAIPELQLAEVTGATAPDLTLATAAVDAAAADAAGTTAAGASGTAAVDLGGGNEVDEDYYAGDLTAAEPLAAETSAFNWDADFAAEQDQIQLAGLQNVGADDWFPNPLPEWSYNCMPCPVNYYSPGGQQGVAQCQPCPGVFTTAGATAAANCMFPYCGAGLEPTRLGRCKKCPIGTYNGNEASNEPCYRCPKRTTTTSKGSTHYLDCKVPVCGPGTELDIDILVCIPCRTKNSISSGGAPSQGIYQPICEECPWGQAANAARTECVAGVCPQPDAFSVKCNLNSLRNDTNFYPCGPGAKSIRIDEYCQAYPPGSIIGMVESTSPLPTRTVPTAESGARVSQEINCPSGAYAPSLKYPAVISFNGRTDCLCRPGLEMDSNCWFMTGTRQVAINGYLDILDPQGFSLINLVRAMAGNRPIGAYTALRSGYCNQQPLDVNVAVNITNITGTFQVERAFTNNLQVNCTGRENYINRIWLNIGLTLSKERANNEIYMPGTLPTARNLTGLRQLTELGCISCGLAGTLPRDWGTEDSFMELRTLDFTGNNFTGTLPETWGYMVNLERLTLSSLNLTQMGRIPAGWGYMRSLRFANFSGLYVDNSTTPPRPCAPWQWANVNALIWNQTLLPPANFPDMVFCNPP